MSTVTVDGTEYTELTDEQRVFISESSVYRMTMERTRQ